MWVTVDLRSNYRFWAFSDRHHDVLERRFPHVRFDVLHCDSDPHDLGRSDVMLTWRFSSAQLQAATNLRWIACPAAGWDHLPVHDAAARGVQITRGIGYHGGPIAEHVMGLVLGFARGLFLSAARQRSRSWWKDEIAEEFFDVAGSTLLVVGCGAVGQALARLASAAGMRVVGVRRRLPDRHTPYVDQWVDASNLDDALAMAHVVVDLLPASASTAGFFDADRFAALRRGGVFINVGRGSTVVEADLLAALNAGQVSWCGLDVTASKPPASDDPLRHHPRVVLTPKCAVFSHSYMEDAVAFFADNLDRFLTGAPLIGLIDAGDDVDSSTASTTSVGA